MYRPLKAIYLKSNPGTSGSGIIEDILFENIHIEQALWWTIWIGPQQQNQPGDSSGTGCSFLYPFDPTCPTQPLVTMKNITLEHIIAIDTIPIFEGPGVVLCDEVTPCVEFNFNNITNTVFDGNATDFLNNLPINVPQIIFPTKYRSDDWEFEYIIENVYGSSINNEPIINFIE